MLISCKTINLRQGIILAALGYTVRGVEEPSSFVSTSVDESSSIVSSFAGSLVASAFKRSFVPAIVATSDVRRLSVSSID